MPPRTLTHATSLNTSTCPYMFGENYGPGLPEAGVPLNKNICSDIIKTIHEGLKRTNLARAISVVTIPRHRLTYVSFALTRDSTGGHAATPGSPTRQNLLACTHAYFNPKVRNRSRRSPSPKGGIPKGVSDHEVYYMSLVSH